jgi:hypothetical protein
MGEANKAKVVKWINEMDATEIEKLVDKYSQKKSNVDPEISSQEYIDTSIDIFLLRSSKDDLVGSYLNEDPVINLTGCNLSDFLNNEMTNQVL